MDSKLLDALECKICCNQYESTAKGRRPLNLGCGHTYCRTPPEEIKTIKNEYQKHKCQTLNFYCQAHGIKIC